MLTLALVALISGQALDPSALSGAPKATGTADLGHIYSPAEISGLQAWWTGNTVTSTIWPDSSGSGKTLTLFGGATKPTRVSPDWAANGAASAKFYATHSQYAEVATASDWTFLTTSAGHTGYIQFIQQQGAGGIIASSFGSSFGNGTGIGVWLPSGQLRLFIGNGNTSIASYQSAAAAIPYWVPTTLIWRLNGSTNLFDVWIDGVLVNSSAAGGYTSTPPTEKLRFGAYSTPTGGTFLGAKIIDAAFWNRPLTGSAASGSSLEIAKLIAFSATKIAPVFAASTTRLNPPLTGTVKVMYIGDSITEGITGTATLLGGYRHRVYDLNCGLADTGAVVDGIGPYVGTLNGFGYPDNQGNGFGGAIVRNANATQPGHATGSFLCVTAPGGCINTMIGTGNAYHPDIIAVMLGINNITGIAESDIYSVNLGTDWCNLIADMHVREPAARFVLMSVLPTQNPIPQTAAFNREIMACSNWLATQPGGAVQLIRADTAAAITTQFADAVHPDAAGQTLVGDVVCPAIRRSMGYNP